MAEPGSLRAVVDASQHALECLARYVAEQEFGGESVPPGAIVARDRLNAALKEVDRLLAAVLVHAERYASARERVGALSSLPLLDPEAVAAELEASEALAELRALIGREG